MLIDCQVAQLVSLTFSERHLIVRRLLADKLMNNSGYELIVPQFTIFIRFWACFSWNRMWLTFARQKKKTPQARLMKYVVCPECDNGEPLFTTLIGVNDILYTGVKGA